MLQQKPRAVRSSPLVAAEWQAILQGEDELGITRKLIAARAARPADRKEPRSLLRRLRR
jgi:hypothetical protein